MSGIVLYETRNPRVDTRRQIHTLRVAAMRRARDQGAKKEEQSTMISQSALPRRTLGRTGLEVSILGFGTAPLGDLFLEHVEDTAIAAASRAFELGINLLDPPPHYGNGLSEHRCGRALRRVPRKEVVRRAKTGRRTRR